MSTPEKFRDAAETLAALSVPRMNQGYVDYTAGFLLESADALEAAAAQAAEVEALAKRLAHVWWTTGHPDDWLAAAREAMAWRDEQDQPAPEPAPATIPVDATGLKGRLARVVGPLIYSDGSPVSWPLAGASIVQILTLDGDGDAHVEVTQGKHPGNDGHIAASSLALIPDEPEAVPEPPVGTRLRDIDGLVWVRDEDETAYQWQATTGFQPRRNWGQVMAFGPLHQVFDAWAEIPHGVTTQDSRGVVQPSCMVPCPFPRHDTAHGLTAPFTAVLPFRADQ